MTGIGHMVASAGVGVIAGSALGTYGVFGSTFGGAAVGAIGMMIGGLLPDIDSPTSKLGRYIHIPVEHRTITHTIWAVLALSVIAWLMPLGSLSWFIVAGYLLHLVCDACGRAGICWTWPCVRYITYTSGAYVAPHHTWKLYRNGEGSEMAFTIGVLIVAYIVVPAVIKAYAL